MIFAQRNRKERAVESVLCSNEQYGETKTGVGHRAISLRKPGFGFDETPSEHAKDPTRGRSNRREGIGTGTTPHFEQPSLVYQLPDDLARRWRGPIDHLRCQTSVPSHTNSRSLSQVMCIAWRLVELSGMVVLTRIVPAVLLPAPSADDGQPTVPSGE